MNSKYLNTANLIKYLNDTICPTQEYIFEDGGEDFGWQETDVNRFDYNYGSANFIINRLGDNSFQLDYQDSFTSPSEFLQTGSLDEIVSAFDVKIKSIPMVISQANADDMPEHEHLFLLLDAQGFNNVGEHLTLQACKDQSGNNYVLDGFDEITNVEFFFDCLDIDNKGQARPYKYAECMEISYPCGCRITVSNEVNTLSKCTQHKDLI